MFSEDSRALGKHVNEFCALPLLCIERLSIVQSFPIQVFDWHVERLFSTTAGPSLTLHLVHLKNSWELIWYYNPSDSCVYCQYCRCRLRWSGHSFPVAMSLMALRVKKPWERRLILSQLWAYWMFVSVIFSCVSNSQVICGQRLLLKWHKGLVHSMKMNIVIICSSSCHSKTQKEMWIPAHCPGFSFPFQL